MVGESSRAWGLWRRARAKGALLPSLLCCWREDRLLLVRPKRRGVEGGRRKEVFSACAVVAVFCTTGSRPKEGKAEISSERRERVRERESEERERESEESGVPAVTTPRHATLARSLARSLAASLRHLASLTRSVHALPSSFSLSQPKTCCCLDGLQPAPARAAPAAAAAAAVRRVYPRGASWE